ncbi:hypothetical protein BS50DRAFT_54607 [Corynespora cassiicola Philippines]|uniref:Uncharacterized protein n=1 Tax=Corynespora cassiicola Philippines TaxID=1448308 RepID=A0A2T2NJ46_CORCC|nr:hypothetical protein BS50DRAFT_54607 [Corynespora cassiicola Philippines]
METGRCGLQDDYLGNNSMEAGASSEQQPATSNQQSRVQRRNRYLAQPSQPVPLVCWPRSNPPQSCKIAPRRRIPPLLISTIWTIWTIWTMLPSICPSRPPALHVHARTPARPYAYTPVRAPTPTRPLGWPCEPSPHLHRHGSIRACVERQMAYLVMVQCPMCPVCASGAVWRPYIAHPKV